MKCLFFFTFADENNFTGCVHTARLADGLPHYGRQRGV